MNLKGKWEGKLVDASGASAAIELTLADRRGRLEGDFSIYFLVDEAVAVAGSAVLRNQVLVTGRVSAKTGSVRLDYKVTIGGRPTQVQYKGKVVRKTNGHARAAVVGCFSTGGGATDILTLGGGGAVLWRYAG